jgi:hypothetical protein
MNRLRMAFLVTLSVLSPAGRVYSHHSFAAVYDGSKQVTVSGVVTLFKFVNPHAMAYMEVKDPSGKKTKWIVEFDGRLNLSNFGWTEHTIKPGEQLSVTGNPSHTEENRMFFVKLVRSDGTELLRGAIQRYSGVDEERRQRALQRSQQK